MKKAYHRDRLFRKFRSLGASLFLAVMILILVSAVVLTVIHPYANEAADSAPW